MSRQKEHSQVSYGCSSCSITTCTSSRVVLVTAFSTSAWCEGFFFCLDLLSKHPFDWIVSFAISMLHHVTPSYVDISWNLRCSANLRSMKKLGLQLRQDSEHVIPLVQNARSYNYNLWKFDICKWPVSLFGVFLMQIFWRASWIQLESWMICIICDVC